MFDRQTAFAKVLTHLRQQGQQAVDEDGDCMYRGLNNTMCAVGCLIPDDRYDTDMEMTPATAGIVYDAIEGEPGEDDSQFVLEMQQMLHDQFIPIEGGPTFNEWLEGRAKEFAEIYSLQVPA